MTPKKLSDDLSVSPQILPGDVAQLAALGFKSIIANRPDGEGADQPSFSEIEREAEANGLSARYIPVETGKVSDADSEAFGAAFAEMPKPVLAYCRSGTRSTTLWALSEAGRRPMADILSKASTAGYNMSGVASRIAAGGSVASNAPVEKYDIVIVGGGAAGAAVAGSLYARKSNLNIAIIEPADVHYYQPGWTLVGGGVFTPEQTARPMGSVLPRRTTWIKAAVAGFDPDNNSVVIEGCRTIRYEHLVVCPGLKLNWGGVEGLTETLGKNGVTSNYRYDLALYTWELVKSLKSGRAIFTQPPMPIKCAGAPQKAMYLSADHWLRTGCLDRIAIEFDNAGAVLFGVADYVPALMSYIERYHVDLNFGSNLVAVDGPAKRATFAKALPDGTRETIEKPFDMMHVCPPQTAPDFIRASSLADAAGWVDVDPATLRHKTYKNIFGLGDVTNTPNAKTAAAARKQAPVVAENLLHDMGVRPSICVYDGYGSCPLTVERGKIVLAEFTYGGKLAPSFPLAFIDGRKPSRAAWMLKERILPPIYWQAMLKGREWMAKPKVMA
ncbi:TIGR01244 family sulfur transferase [Hyphomicrobium sp.]|jgi:sulfide:quinone oxidoreductase|uniref:TIGR01244 family sulfur transferase n=1 Tax=Hyphomicrobium sp. TaxID=82 RepID=UPI00356888A7